MTTTTERPTKSVRMSAELVDLLSRNGWEFGDPGPDGFYSPSVRIGGQYREALATERRATVERLRSAIEAGRISAHGTVITPDIDAILDEEAAR